MPEKDTYTPTAEETLIHAIIKEDRDTTSIQSGFSWSDLITFRNYKYGKQKLELTDKIKDKLKGIGVDTFADNICNQIVSESNGRITFTGWTCKNEAVKNWLDEFFKLAKLDRRQSDFHNETLTDGNFAVAVRYDEDLERVKLYKEKWWDGESGIYLHYGDDAELEYAVKEWSETELVTGEGNVKSEVRIKRRLVWFADSVYRWKSLSTESTKWVPAPLDSDESWPLPWLDKDGDPLGIPYVHFPNVYKTYGDYGVSELDGGVLGFQDMINDAQLSISLSVRYTGAQIYWGTGVNLDGKKDNNSSDTKTLEIMPGSFIHSPNPEAQFGVLPAGDIDKQIAGYHLKLKRVSQMTATPLHTITGGDWPSGEALLRAEMPAVNKAWTQIFQFATSWIEVATKALKMYNRFSGKSEIDYDITKGIIEAQFIDPERRDAISRSIMVHNLAANISKKEALRIMGYSEEKAQDIYDEILEEGQDASEAIIAQMRAANPTGSTKESQGGNNNTNSDAQ